MSSKPRLWLCMRDVMSYSSERGDGDQTVNLYLNSEDVQYDIQTEKVSIRPRVTVIYGSADNALGGSAGSIAMTGETRLFVFPQGTAGVKINITGSGRHVVNVWGSGGFPHAALYHDMNIKVELLRDDDTVIQVITPVGSYSFQTSPPNIGTYYWNGQISFTGALAPGQATAYKLRFSYTVGDSIRVVSTNADYGETNGHDTAFNASWDNFILTYSSVEQIAGEVNYVILEDNEVN